MAIGIYATVNNMTALEERRLRAVEDGVQKLKSAIQVLCENGNHEYHAEALNIVEGIQPTLKPRNVSEDDHERLCRSLMTLMGLLPVIETLRQSLAMDHEDLVALVKRGNLAGELRIVLGAEIQIDDLTLLLRALISAVENFS